MSWIRVLVSRFTAVFRRDRLEEELRFHLEMQTDDNLRAGMTPEAARQAALRSFGGVGAIAQTYRDASKFMFLEAVLQDVRYTLRSLRRSPAFAVTATATLAIAIAANTVTFAVLDAVVLRPLPFPSPEQLVMLWTGDGRSAHGNVEQWRRQTKSFSELAVFDPVSATLTGSEYSERVSVARVSAEFFSLVGVQPALGRVFSAREAEERQPVVLLSHGFWQKHFGGNKGAIGAWVELDRQPSRVVGVLPEGFQFPKLEVDLWEPHTLFPDWAARRALAGADTWFVLGRLRLGVSLQVSRAEMQAIARAMDEQMPMAERNRGVRVTALRDYALGSKPTVALWMLGCVVFCVLLIAAANVASLSLARAVARGREFGIRAALGASGFRIARQLLVESMCLAGLGGLCALLLANAAIPAVRASGFGDLPQLDKVIVDARVLLWTMLLTVMTAALVGLAPVATMRQRRTMRLHRTLVVAEFAVAIILLVGAGLMIRSWQYLERVDPGFRSDRVFTMQVRTPVGMGAPQANEFREQLLREIAAKPGIGSVGLLSDLFIGNYSEQNVTVEGGRTPVRIQYRRDEIAGEAFQALGTRLIRGRFFSPDDRADAPRVAILNEAMARRLWGATDPTGRKFQPGDGPWFTVVGVIADMRRQGIEFEPIPQMFEAMTQKPSGGGVLVLRTSADDPAALVRAAVRAVDKNAIVYGAAALEDLLYAKSKPRRVQTSLVTGFAAVALVLAAIGIYGLIDYSITARRQEIGIRMAIGAQRADIFRMVLQEGLKLSLSGLAIGLGAALWAMRGASALLAGVSASDPLTLVAVSLLLIAVGMTACLSPARRAMTVEPAIALRNQ